MYVKTSKGRLRCMILRMGISWKKICKPDRLKNMIRMAIRYAKISLGMSSGLIKMGIGLL